MPDFAPALTPPLTEMTRPNEQTSLAGRVHTFITDASRPEDTAKIVVIRPEADRTRPARRLPEHPSKDEWWAYLAERDYRCEACGARFEFFSDANRDHDHRHDAAHPELYYCVFCIRGALCSSCNKALGRHHDNPESLDEAGLTGLAEFIHRTMDRIDRGQPLPLPKKPKPWRAYGVRADAENKYPTPPSRRPADRSASRYR